VTYEFPFDVDAVAYSPPSPCGRLTKRGTACQQSPLAYWRLPKRENRPRSCLHHLTAEERAEYDREVAAAEAAEQESNRKVDAMIPACWSWEMPTAPAPRDPDPDVAGLAVIDEWQGGRCAICSAQGVLVTDHDHSTGLVRGLLCHRCNTAEAARTAGPYRRYRERPPAAILGVQTRYWDPLAKAHAEPQNVVREAGKWVDAASEDIL
jgi:hypothetical protein